MAAKSRRAKRRISLSSEEEEHNKSDTGDETDLNQANNNKNILQLQERRVKRKYKQLKWFIPYAI